MASLLSWLLVMLPFFLLKLLEAAFYMAIAVVTALILLWYVRRHGTAGQLPRRLIWQLVAMGLPVAAIALLLGPVLMVPIDLAAVSGTLFHILLRCYLNTALLEEGGKLLFLKLSSWRHPTFTNRFNGVIYAVCVGLGFAAAENVMYMLTEDVSTVLLRCITSVPHHMALGVVMGTFYGRAKMCEQNGDIQGQKNNLWRSFLLPAFLHGTTNALALFDTTFTTVLFFVSIGCLVVWAFRQLRREAVYAAKQQDMQMSDSANM